MPDLQTLLDLSARDHHHLCPRQILGVRMGLAGLAALGFAAPPVDKGLLVIAESDGCFVDGLSAATACTVGHRTLRIEDYGKVAAVFVDCVSGRAVRLAPHNDVRQRAAQRFPEISAHYTAQMQAYQVMSAEALFTSAPVELHPPLAQILSRPGLRQCCASCGEEIMNERGVQREGQYLCQSCAGHSYYTAVGSVDA